MQVQEKFAELSQKKNPKVYRRVRNQLARAVVGVSQAVRKLGFTNVERKRLIDRLNKTVDTMRSLDRQIQNLEKKAEATRSEDQRKEYKRQARTIGTELEKMEQESGVAFLELKRTQREIIQGDMVGVTPAPETTFELVSKNDSMRLKALDDYVAYDQTQHPFNDIEADIVYVGYGIEAPEYNWDDYKGVDVRGKVLLMLVNEPTSDDPKFFKGRALTYYGRWTYKFEQAARKGAVGAILIHKTEMASYPWEVVRNSNSGEKSYLKAESPQLKAAGWIQLEVAKRLARVCGMDISRMIDEANSRDFHPVSLPARLKAHMVSKIRPFSSNNVVAVLPGADPKLKDEAVIYTAHYDHLGIRPDMPGDNIYNGARDNATGCGILLELARVFAQSPARPRRSILFASVKIGRAHV